MSPASSGPVPSDPGTFDPAPGACIAVAPGVCRILAPNPSPMTFRGTNTYIVGQGTVAVIDPGPDDPGHLTAILGAIGSDRVSHILVTHAHRDHSALAPDLSARTGAPILGFGPATAGRSPLMQRLVAKGLTSGGEGVDSDFTADRRLQDGDVVESGTWRIRALHTPGHMANHMCFEMGGVLFTGDHVMGWASSLVSPPDGDISDFLSSCTRLSGLDHHIYLPGHGAPVRHPHARLADLIAHRQSRTEQILKALEGGPATIPALTETLYAAVPQHLHRAAARNVFAHLIDLTQQNLVRATPNVSPEATYARRE